MKGPGQGEGPCMLGYIQVCTQGIFFRKKFPFYIHTFSSLPLDLPFRGCRMDSVRVCLLVVDMDADRSETLHFEKLSFRNWAS